MCIRDRPRVAAAAAASRASCAPPNAEHGIKGTQKRREAGHQKRAHLGKARQKVAPKRARGKGLGQYEAFVITCQQAPTSIRIVSSMAI
eukprot:3030390-Pleurochrysis_carterae.AAC.1